MANKAKGTTAEKKGLGGGVFVDSASTLVAVDATFFNNTAATHGGAVFNNYGVVDDSGVTFAGNEPDVRRAVFCVLRQNKSIWLSSGAGD